MLHEPVPPTLQWSFYVCTAFSASTSLSRIISNSHVRLLTQCSQCLGINVFLAQFQPSIWNRWIPLFQSEHAPCAPYVTNVWGPCVALYSLLMLLVSLEALQGSELVACSGEQHLSKQGNGVFSTCTPAAVVAAGNINKCWDETDCLGVFFFMLAMHNHQCFSWHCLLSMSLLTQRTLEWCAGNLARLSSLP